MSLSKRDDRGPTPLAPANTEARYDDYKEQSYKKATREYTTVWRGNSKEMYKWIKEQL